MSRSQYDYDEDDFEIEDGSEQTFSDIILTLFLKTALGLTLAPYEATRILLQVQNRNNVVTATKNENEKEKKYNDFENGYDAFKKVGFWRLYSGVSAYCMSLASHSISHTFFQNLLAPEMEYIAVPNDEDGPDDILEIHEYPVSDLAYGGSVAGATLLATLVSCPFDCIYTRMLLQRKNKNKNGQTSRYSNFFSTISTIYEEEGISAFYVGLVPHAIANLTCVLFDTFADAFLEFIYDECLDMPIHHYRGLYFFSDLALHALRFGISSPFETVARRLQIQSNKGKTSSKLANIPSSSPSTKNENDDCVIPVTKPTYTDTLDCLTRVISEEGPGQLFHGVFPHLSLVGFVLGFYYVTI